ncbi:MAG: MBL fold metallo-hydrolase [Chloroflexota bacterium]|nr:MBL fold metallo-hydrolase [Chloroflexota bacterium]
MKEIASNVYVSTAYPGVNVGFIVLPEGVIAVDAPTLPQDARAWRERIVETAGGPILYVVLTDAHPDRVLSAELLKAPIVAGRAAYDRAIAYTDGFWRGVIDGWQRRHPEAADDLAGSSIALPEILFDGPLTLHKGGEDVKVRSVAGGAPGSAWVDLPERQVLFAGDHLVVGTHPFMEAALDTKTWLYTLKWIRRDRFSNTIIVPGRGPLCDQSATSPLSEYIALARRRALSLVKGAREDKAAMVDELLSFFPVSEDEAKLVRRNIKAGLDQLCDELQVDEVSDK